jgi:hypothetical protein
MKGEIDFSRLQKEKISKESFLKSSEPVKEDAENKPLGKSECQAGAGPLLFRSCLIEKSFDIQAFF